LLEREKWREALAHSRRGAGWHFWMRVCRPIAIGICVGLGPANTAFPCWRLSWRALQIPSAWRDVCRWQLGELRRRLAAAGLDASGRAVAPAVLWPPSRWRALLELPGLPPEVAPLAPSAGPR
jgi:hypothetical protein